MGRVVWTARDALSARTCASSTIPVLIADRQLARGGNAGPQSFGPVLGKGMNDTGKSGLQTGDGPGLHEPLPPLSSPAASTTSAQPAAEKAPESLALKRRYQRIALIEELGGHGADFKKVAIEAIKRGMYSPRTNRGDVELSLLRTWKLRKRLYGR